MKRSPALQLDEIIRAGVAAEQPYHWIVAYGQQAPYAVIAPRVSEWMRLGLLEALDEWFTGRARRCIHRPDAQARDLAVACSVRPGVVACEMCEATMMHRVADQANWRLCALCGSPSVEIFSSTFGTLTYRAPICVDCKPIAEAS